MQVENTKDTEGMVNGMKVEKVDFYGDSVLCIKDEEGQVWVPIRKLCKNLGIDPANQRVKIQEDESYQWSVTTSVDSSGRNYKMFCLKLECLQGWLFSISSNKVKAELKEKLLKYKQECFRVLNEYWTTGMVIHPQIFSLSHVDMEALVHKAVSTAYNLATTSTKEQQLKLLNQEIDTYAKIKNDWPETHNWTETCVRVKVDLYENNDNPDTSKDPFFLSDVFRDLGLKDKEANKCAKMFGKLERVKDLCRGGKRQLINGNVKAVNYYYLKDFAVIKEMAREWYLGKAKQKTIWEQCGLEAPRLLSEEEYIKKLN